VVRCSRRPVAVIGLRDAEYRLSSVVEGFLTVRSLRGVLAASVCLLAVPVALLFQLMVGSGDRASAEASGLHGAQRPSPEIHPGGVQRALGCMLKSHPDGVC
jgi:hypothetical protein